MGGQSRRRTAIPSKSFGDLRRLRRVQQRIAAAWDHGGKASSGRQPQEHLTLEGTCLHRLPEEVRSLLHLRAINLSRNRFRHFPEPLTAVGTLETIELEENEITASKEEP
nr:PREDICTED: leucine-rich repeat-containing protein 20 [Struthio camelus australis]